ncbi:MAG: hypothetical protein RBS91_05175 [Sulfurimonadaceae bacterium]|nr:hypothetical protein [Sulfurimonadaceae bacterium]
MKSKINLILSLLFAIVSSFSAVHQVQHLKSDHHSSNCSICIINKNIVSDDAIAIFSEVERAYFDKIDEIYITLHSELKPQLLKNRDPPPLFS